MKIKHLITDKSRPNRRKLAAFSIVEVTMGMSVVGMSCAALFSGYTTGIFTIQMSRENLRATQIMLQKMESLRLASWDQINTPGYIPAKKTEYYNPNGANGNMGLAYEVYMSINDLPFATAYSSEMKMATVTVNWTTGRLNRTRTLTTYVARNGLQNYIY